LAFDVLLGVAMIITVDVLCVCGVLVGVVTVAVGEPVLDEVPELVPDDEEAVLVDEPVVDDGGGVLVDNGGGVEVVGGGVDDVLAAISKASPRIGRGTLP